MQPFYLIGSVAALAPVVPAIAAEQPAAESRYELPAQPLAESIRAVGLASGQSIVAPGTLVDGKIAPPLIGHYSPEAALGSLLSDSGLSFRRDGTRLVVFRPGLQPTESRETVGEEEAIVVTGTRIRGAPIASPVISLDDEQLRRQGKATLAEAVRTIPQNFGGGQNPGIGNNVPGSNGVNVGSATSVNLRGLGSDATLTLVNGHRLSYSASRQAIDISAVPLGAVDRVEVVPDGASALYGSDAVAGVVNVILKRNFEGVETSARLAHSTSGGGFEQRYGTVAGTRWDGGGIFAAYEYGRTTAIRGKHRSYTDDRPTLTLYPFIKHHSAVLSAHQQLAHGLSIEVDALYNKRLSSSSFATTPEADIETNGVRFSYASESFVIAPTLRLDIGDDWRLFVTGSYGEDRTNYDSTIFVSGLVFDFGGNCYCNNAKAVELGGDGKLAELPAGPVRLAAGVGYRYNKLVRFNGVGAITNANADQDSYYAYGELSLPLLSADERVPLVDKLLLTGALRYENYPSIGGVATPKIGLIWGLTPDLEIKASWGKSFRAPTLQQQFGARLAVLSPASEFGNDLPAGTTAMVIDGSNPDLDPERATSWSATVDFHPEALDGLRLELSYFRTRYRDRVVTPILFISQAISNPLFSDRLTFDPSPVLQADVIAGSVAFHNTTGSPYDPGNVAVLIDNSYANAARQLINGADLLASYRTAMNAGDLLLTLNATYLDSNQQLGKGQQSVPLAGILFNPPHFKARASASWSRNGFTLTGSIDHIGGVDDTRQPTSVRVNPMTTFDLTLSYESPTSAGILSGFNASLTVQNLFGAKPGRIATNQLSDFPYDSTNYSPLGRFVALSLGRKW